MADDERFEQEEEGADVEGHKRRLLDEGDTPDATGQEGSDDQSDDFEAHKHR